MRARVWPAAALACAALCAGCSLTAGSADTGSASTSRSQAAAGSPRSAAAAIARADRTHELPTPAPRETVVGGWPTPAQAVRAFATIYTNWTAATISIRLRTLAEVSVGQARSALELAASEAADDYELRRGGIANAGVVEAIQPMRGRPGLFVVVTRERTTATADAAYRGLAPAWHVTLATVAEIQGGEWVVSTWQPQN